MQLASAFTVLTYSVQARVILRLTGERAEDRSELICGGVDLQKLRFVHFPWVEFTCPLGKGGDGERRKLGSLNSALGKLRGQPCSFDEIGNEAGQSFHSVGWIGKTAFAAGGVEEVLVHGCHFGYFAIEANHMWQH